MFTWGFQGVENKTRYDEEVKGCMRQGTVRVWLKDQVKEARVWHAGLLHNTNIKNTFYEFIKDISMILTQKMKLNRKSKNLTHFIAPSTAMVNDNQVPRSTQTSRP